MCWALRFEFGMGMVPNDAFSMHLELMPNFHGKNPVAFHHIFVAEIPQRFTLSALNHTKHYYYQAFAMRIRQQGASFSRQKSSRVSRLVHYGALARSHVCVYGTYCHAHIEMNQSPSKYQAC